jgi:acetyl esterase/lipase
VYEQAACAVHFARQRAADYGGDPARVTLLGWSDGALIGAVVASAGDRFAGRCTDGDLSSALPDSFVGVGGFLGWPTEPDGSIDPDYVNERTTRFFGGSPALSPDAWRDGNPYRWLDRRPGLDIGLIVGADDLLLDHNAAFATAARAAGHRVNVTVVPGAGPLHVLAASTAEGAATVRAVLQTASAKPRHGQRDG